MQFSIAQPFISIDTKKTALAKEQKTSYPGALNYFN